MSWRALGRQWKAQKANRGKPWIEGTPWRPQGRLFDPGPLPKFKLDRDIVESGRRRMAGENNPAAPWEKGRIFQHHFLGYDSKGRPRKPPVQGEL